MDNNLVDFFTKIGFKVDTASVRQVKTQLADLKKQVDSTFSGVRGGSKLSGVQKASQKVKEQGRLLEASQLKILRVSKENANKNVQADELLRQSKLKYNLQDKKARTNILRMEQQTATLQRQSALKESLLKTKAATQTKILNAKTKNNDSFTSRLREKGILSNISAENNINRLRQQSANIERSTANVRARTSQVHARNQGVLHNTELARVRQAIQTEKFAMRSSMGMPTHRGGGQGGGGTVRTGAIGGLTASGAFGGLAAGAAVTSAYRAGSFQMGLEPQFEFLTGSAEEAKKEIAFINSEVDRLSLSLGDATSQYRQLFAAGGKKLGSEKTQSLFTGVQEISTMLGLSTDMQNRSMRAFSQINCLMTSVMVSSKTTFCGKSLRA